MKKKNINGLTVTHSGHTHLRSKIQPTLLSKSYSRR